MINTTVWPTKRHFYEYLISGCCFGIYKSTDDKIIFIYDDVNNNDDY